MTKPKVTKPDRQSAIERTAQSMDTVEKVQGTLTKAFQALSDALSNEPTLETVVLVQAAVKSWSKQLEDTGTISKAILLDALQKQGKKTTDKGSLQLEVSGWQVEARPHRTGLDPKKVEALIREKGLSVDELMDRDIRYLVNDMRLESAVAEELLTKDELETCRYELSYALQPFKRVR